MYQPNLVLCNRFLYNFLVGKTAPKSEKFADKGSISSDIKVCLQNDTEPIMNSLFTFARCLGPRAAGVGRLEGQTTSKSIQTVVISTTNKIFTK